ncbi:hypothetical protein [Spirosoma sp. KUDC1026]|uniref:hypothetical protein n=1 Tax=Spirosoma sp. KUDC1026 TaxID=2745947 RepID=UPI00159BE34F|nr:hypothetical protein [Spirosoma sp. KUDC1026]QKZ13308.1 hypothetical protein HU175_11970 [Spirosoma sp. KUDC1026]
MNSRRLAAGLLIWLAVAGTTACQSRTRPAEQTVDMRPDTTIFDDDTLEGAIRDSIRPSNHRN